VAWSTMLQYGTGPSGRAGVRTSAGIRSLSLPLLRFSVVLFVAVILSCLYTWEQLAMSRLLDGVQALETARRRAYEQRMVELEKLRSVSGRPDVEARARELGLAPVGTGRLMVRRPIEAAASPGGGPS